MTTLVQRGRVPLVSGLWLVALGHLTVELCHQYLPILYPTLIANMGMTYTQVGLIALVATAGTTLAQPFFGYVSDSWGPERMSSFSIMWVGVLMGLVGAVVSFPALLILVGMASLGSAAFHPASAVIAASSSGTKRGTGISVFSVGGNVGSALSPLAMGVALAYFGMRGTLFLIPVSVTVGLFVYLQMRQLAIQRRERQAATHGEAAAGFRAGLILIVVGMMFRSWFQVAVTTYLPVWVGSSSDSLVAGATLLSLLLFSIAVGSLVGGPLSDRVGHWQVVAVGMFALSPALWMFVNLSGPWQPLAIGVMGLAIGATYPASIVIALESWPRHVGVASGLLMGIGWLPGGLGASVTGLIADHSSLTIGLQSLLLPPWLGLACVLLYAMLKRRRDMQGHRAAVL